ncbi:MAG: hypothetical protein ACK55I_28925, partial [bacterium]
HQQQRGVEQRPGHHRPHEELAEHEQDHQQGRGAQRVGHRPRELVDDAADGVRQRRHQGLRAGEGHARQDHPRPGERGPQQRRAGLPLLPPEQERGDRVHDRQERVVAAEKAGDVLE